VAKIVSDQTAIWLTDADVAAPTPAAITGVTSANPAVVSMTTLPAGLVNGDLVLLDGTGNPDIDGKYFTASSVGTPANSFTLVGMDTTGDTAMTAGTAAVYNLGGDDPEFLKACQSTITLNGQEPDSVDLSDMCDAMTKLGDPKPPTVSFTGFVNSEDEGFKNMIQASLESPKSDRLLMLLFPDGEYIVGPAEVGAISVSAARGQGLSYSGTATYTEVPTYSWALE
jgi:hypothetical protein